MKKLRTAIIGYGRSGRDIHTRLLRQLPGLYEITAYVERDQLRRDMIKSEMGIDSFSTIDELLPIKDDIDLVIVASYSDDHPGDSIFLLKNGFTVLSEKPAAKNNAEFESIVQTSLQYSSPYYVFQQYRFSPAYNKVKEVIESGVLGRVLQINLQYSKFGRRWDWQTIHKRSAGSLLNTGPHPIDHALDLMDFPQSVKVISRMERANSAGDGEDFVKLILLSEDKPILDIEISNSNAYSDYTYLVQGTRGSLIGSAQKLNWKYFIDSENQSQPLIEDYLRNEKGEPIYCQENLIMHEDEWVAKENDNNAKGKAFFITFYETLTKGEPFPVLLDHISLQMQVIGEAHLQNESLFAGHKS